MLKNAPRLVGGRVRKNRNRSRVRECGVCLTLSVSLCGGVRRTRWPGRVQYSQYSGLLWLLYSTGSVKSVPDYLLRHLSLCVCLICLFTY
jgi:hypothetical protein